MYNKISVKQTLFPRAALLVIDVQNDLIDGSIALIDCPANERGHEVIPAINQLISTVQFDAIVYTQDWHTAEHCSFIENVQMRKISNKSPVRKNIFIL